MGPLEPELLLCVPGPWNDRSEFVRTIVSETDGEFLFAGMIMAQPGRNEHVPLDFAPHDPQMGEAFEIARQGQLPEPLLQQPMSMGKRPRRQAPLSKLPAAAACPSRLMSGNWRALIAWCSRPWRRSDGWMSS